MLYDPKQAVRAQLIALRDWLSKRNPKEQYNWSSHDDCILCRYLGRGWDQDEIDEMFGEHAAFIGCGRLGRGGIDWTVRGALKRVRHVLRPRQHD